VSYFWAKSGKNLLIMRRVKNIWGNGVQLRAQFYFNLHSGFKKEAFGQFFLSGI
jgi:hypothetical protein